jgi:RNA polymerase-binding transcription factor DksA
MTNLNLEHFKNLLLEEQKRLEEELSSLGQKNPDNSSDWEASVSDYEEDDADPTMQADAIEELESNSAVLEELEIQLKDVKDALVKIEDGTYGICEVSGHQIEEGRLEANPAARTCMEHMGE